MVDTRAVIGTPYRMLDTKQRKLRQENTYTVISQLADITGTASRMYRESRDASMERQANTDIINDTINPDLAHQEGMYAKTVAKAKATEDFYQLKNDVENGMYDNMRPVDYQNLLRDGHIERAKSYAGTSFEIITNDAHNNFWKNNEPMLVAGQSGRYRTKLKNDMTSKLGKVVGMQVMNKNTNPQDIINSLNDPDYTMLTYEDRSELGLSIAAMAGANGDSTLLSALDKEYKYSINPDTSKTFNTAMKTARQRQMAASLDESMKLRTEYDRKRSSGELDISDWDVVKNKTGPDGKPVVTYKEFSKALVTANTNRIKAVSQSDTTDAVNNLQDVSMKPAKEQQVAFTKIIKGIIESDASAADQGNSVGVRMSIQKNPSKMLQSMGSEFGNMPALNKDGSPNKLVEETYGFYKGMQQGFQSEAKFQDNIGDEAYARMKNMDHIFNTTKGSMEEKTQAAMEMLAVIQERRDNGAITSTVRIPEDVETGLINAAQERLEADDKIYRNDPDKPNNTSAGDYLRHGRANYLWNLNKLGVSEEIALEMSVNKTNKQFVLFDGALSITDGADWDFGTSHESIANALREDTAIQSLVAAHQGTPEADMDKIQLYLNAESDTVVVTDQYKNIIYQIPTEHAKVIYQSLHQDVNGDVNYDLQYSDAVLATEAGREWADHASLRNDIFTVDVINAQEDPAVTPGITLPTPEEWLEMPEQEKTETQVEYYRQSLLSVNGLALAIGQIQKGAFPTGIKVLADAGIKKYQSVKKAVTDHLEFLQENVGGIPRVPKIVDQNSIKDEVQAQGTASGVPQKRTGRGQVPDTRVLHGKDAIKEVEAIEGEVTPAMKRVVELEGYSASDYTDTKGITTGGVGQTGKFKGKTFKETFNILEKELKGKIPGYNDMPDKVQMELMQAMYRGDIQISPKFVKLLNAKDYTEAADEFLDNAEYKSSKTPRSIKARMKAVADAVRTL